ncbi:cupin [Siphonobacter sp. SORGH_AS_0500]|uniref:cupin domain-containing protein n=1 Tax=Siphonobacter sp. SORGH_AS_0500 TaxID=1864824 RepID=UPI000CB1D068|nr:cupin domain-containing protein [Siphonobacter sp. SORGH_AS_0500]PKK37729.1 cupin [Siphonobacter sp. SORGH_AS_0500]
MALNPKELRFVKANGIPWETVGDGLRRKVFTYDANLMMTMVAFEMGAVGSMHQHPHTQVSYVESGVFEITIGEEVKVLHKGDAYYIPPNILHGAVCREPGVLVDVFTPMREDFIE